MTIIAKPDEVVFKYPLWDNNNSAQNECKILIPANSRVVAFNFQNGAPFIWAIVSQEALALKRMEVREFLLLGTGHTIQSLCKYVGTAFCGTFVFHLFEVK